MKEQYAEITFRKSTLALIDTINAIITDYVAQGYMLTVRQIYYQLVTRNAIANDEKNYKLVTRTINDARIAGLMDWDAIEDRVRWMVESIGDNSFPQPGYWPGNVRPGENSRVYYPGLFHRNGIH